MSGCSVLTIVNERSDHLRAQYEGLRQNLRLPDEWVIVSMDEEPPPRAEQNDFPVQVARVDGIRGLPLAAARNRAARLAKYDLLVFLDVDCIPSAPMLSVFGRCTKPNQVLMGSVGYLPKGAVSGEWTFGELESLAEDHPLQPAVSMGERKMIDEVDMFCSLCFATHRETFEKVGGFDERFEGYGGEDTDFAYAGKQAGVEFGYVGTRAFHQHRDSCSPPIDKLDEIVRNAKLFREKWGFWPMRKWLDEFAVRGFTDFDLDAGYLDVARRPTRREIQQAAK